jgi:hypothetical protein
LNLEKKRLSLANGEATRWRFPPAKEALNQVYILVKIDQISGCLWSLITGFISPFQ